VVGGIQKEGTTNSGTLEREEEFKPKKPTGTADENFEKVFKIKIRKKPVNPRGGAKGKQT